MVQRILTPAKDKEFYITNLFWKHIAIHFAIVYQIIWVLASFTMVNITNMFLLGGISFVLVVISISMIMHLHNRLSVSVRDLVWDWRDHVTQERINELYKMKPTGLDTDRLQFLLHDILREESGTDTNTIEAWVGLWGDFHLTDIDGSTPVLLACQYSSPEVVDYLTGCTYENMDSRDKLRDTALHYACRGKNYTVVKYLLETQMQMVTKRNVKGDLPLYLLCNTSGMNSSELDNTEHLEMIWRLLLAYPDDVSHRYKKWIHIKSIGSSLTI